MNSKKIEIISSFGLLLTAAIWGFAFVVVKDSLDYVGAVWMLAFRFSIAAVGLGLIFIKKLKLLNVSYWLHGAILGFFLFMGYLVQTIGCHYTTAGKNAFLTTIYVILIPLISWPLYRKRPAWYVFTAAVLSVTGIGVLALNQSDGSLSDFNIGDLLTIICGFFYAVHIIFVARWNEKEDPILLTVLQFFFAAVFGWVIAPFIKDTGINGPFPSEVFTNPKVILSMLYLGVFSTMIAFFLQNVCLKYVQSALASLFLSFESVFGVLFSTIFLHEAVNPKMLTGCTLIFMSIFLAEVVPNVKVKKSVQ